MRPLNFEVVEKNGESVDKLIKKFIKKTSRTRIVKECIDRMHFTSDSSIRRSKKTRKKYIKQKIQESYENSIKYDK